MIFSKTYDELMKEALDLLPANTPITNLSPGAVARSLLEVINRQIAVFYKTIDLNLAMSFLSSAKGKYLDLIGALLDCSRQDGEDDNNYRYRISQQVYVAAGCNETALRLKLLSEPASITLS